MHIIAVILERSLTLDDEFQRHVKMAWEDAGIPKRTTERSQRRLWGNLTFRHLVTNYERFFTFPMSSVANSDLWKVTAYGTDRGSIQETPGVLDINFFASHPGKGRCFVWLA
jgi:hypothetical protein